MFYEYTKEYILKNDEIKRHKSALFLKTIDIEFDTNVDVTINIVKNNQIAATISAEKNLIKCIGVAPDFRSEGLMNILFSDLISYQYSKGFYNLALFTKAEYETIIASLGFYTICKTKNIVFMENHKNKFRDYLQNLTQSDCKGKVASIVMNLNPITNGHLYLIEKASSENDVLFVFIVSEDRSVVPFDIRYQLAEASTRHLKNVILVKGGEYIISSTTFPSYFKKDYNSWIRNYCELDLTIFSKHIAKKLNISKRYVGTEPYCKVTNYYNKVMSEILPKYNIEYIEVSRLLSEDDAISASRVRKLADEGDFKAIKSLVPEATYKYLISINGGSYET
ncbi:MAG: [citrate (pro-3S)-lyase] ligase [Eubacteriales bacterium]|nr:[citrate (pro-3S)-lyase] ligase [Eubacteriales bacterium]